MSSTPPSVCCAFLAIASLAGIGTLISEAETETKVALPSTNVSASSCALFLTDDLEIRAFQLFEDAGLNSTNATNSSARRYVSQVQVSIKKISKKETSSNYAVSHVLSNNLNIPVEHTSTEKEED